MVKKKFIDKRKAVTYSLIFRSTEDVDDVPERVLVEAEKGVGLGKVDAQAAGAAHAASRRRYPPGHPLAWLEEEPASGPMSEERRRELIELGFPDDGYDYLKHMRVVGRGAASLEGMPAAPAAAAAAAARDEAAAAAAALAAAGPSVYMPAPAVEAPEEDVKVIDASRLTVMQAVEEEQDAAVMAGGVTAFSRQRERVHGVDKRELEELEAVMHELEADDEFGDAEGAGDLLDDFVLAATEFGPEPEGQQGAGQGSESEYSEVESEEEEEEEGSSYAGSGDLDVSGSQAGTLAARSGRPPPKPGSIASTYWRDERTDRKNLLTVIDERFEHLALEYDEEEIGDLEEQGQQIRGFADVSEFENLLDEFLEVHGQTESAREGNVPYAAPRISQVAKELEFHGFDDADAAIAIQKAHEALRRAEEEEAQREQQEAEGGRRAEREPMLPYFETRERERWDCESVLSLRSNLDNHPGRISEPRSSRRRATSSVGGEEAGGGPGRGLIRLDTRGIPRGWTWRGVGSVSESGAHGDAEAAADADAGEQPAPAAAAAALERRKGETAEERKARKAAVKEAQRAARAQKKELKVLFKEAAVQAQRRAATAQPQAAVKLPS